MSLIELSTYRLGLFAWSLVRDAEVRGYGPPAMARTPWGDAAQLREKKLRPGRGTPREEAERNQRERLFAAMVATVAEKGYEATTVADLVKLSGVSRSAFYSTSTTSRPASSRRSKRWSSRR